MMSSDEDNAREEFMAQFAGDPDRQRVEGALTDPLQTQFGGRFEREWARECHDDLRKVDGHEGARECFHIMHADAGWGHE